MEEENESRYAKFKKSVKKDLSVIKSPVRFKAPPRTQQFGSTHTTRKKVTKSVKTKSGKYKKLTRYKNVKVKPSWITRL